MSFVNTADTLGESATLDALIAHTLTEYNDDRITSLRQYAFRSNIGLQKVNLPSLTGVNTRAFYGCTNLEEVDIGGGSTISSNAFQNCSKLKTLIIRSTTVTGLANKNAISTSKLGLFGVGGIYVPRSILTSYKSASNWSDYASTIFAIEDMPITDFSTISESWAQIKAAIDNESFFSSGYDVGDIKQLVYGQHTVYAEIRKIDTTNKFVDFVLKNFDETVAMGNSMVAYTSTGAYTRLDTIYNDELPSELKSAITPVAKKYYNYQGNTDTVTVPLWLLNTKDAGLTGDYLKESDGENYYDSNAKRIKYNQQTGSADYWWLGSAYSSSYFLNVGDYGGGNGSSPTYSGGLVFGFRLQKAS